MKNKRFFTDSNFTMPSFLLAIYCLMMLFACQKEPVSVEELPQMPVFIASENLDGKVTDRGLTNCECQYRILSVTPSSNDEMDWYLTSDLFCNPTLQCYYWSAFSDACLPVSISPSCDDLITTIPSNYQWANCSIAPYSSYNVGFYPYVASTSPTCAQINYPNSASIQFQLRCLEKPVGACTPAQYIYSNPYTINYSGGLPGTAKVTLVECGCQAQITAM